MTTKVLSKIEPKDNGAFPTHSDIHTEGGFQVRANTTDRDSIPTLNRKEGMWVKLLSDGKIYSLGSGLTNGDWTEVVFGSSAVVFDSGAPENIKANRLTDPSPIDNTKNGVVNLGSKTTGSSTGATEDYATIGGGDQNTASGVRSVVAGGGSNTASAFNTTVSGGISNTAGEVLATISGGNGNTATGGTASVISGGQSNTSSSCTDSVISGGNTNQITSGTYCSLGGGVNNTINAGNNSTISGGSANSTTGTNCTVSGGSANNAGADNTTVSGGSNNQATVDNSTIGGGYNNTTSGNAATIAGGHHNTVTNQAGTIGGGATNTINADNATICGGTNNTINAGADYSVIVHGYNNQSFGNSSIVTGFEAKSDKPGQHVHSCGNNDATPGGGSQFSRVVYFCESVNAATVDFKEGITNGGYIVESNRTYALKITVVASQAGGVGTEMHIRHTILTVDNSGALFNTPASGDIDVGSTYTISYDTATSNLFKIKFTGDTGVTVRATAVIEAAELLFV